MDARPVVLVHYRPGVDGLWGHLVHAVHRPGPATTALVGSGSVISESVSALCGALLALEQIETVTPGGGMPCTSCLHLRRTAAPVPGSRAEGGDGEGNPPVAAATGYRGLCGWTVSLRRDQVWLSLDRRVTALLIPTAPATAAQTSLTARGRPAPVLTHPDAPGRHVMLAGEPSGVRLPWPSQIQRAIETLPLPLPPTMTPRGPLSWVHLPEADPARLCRESDLFTAVRTALRSPSEARPPTVSLIEADFDTGRVDGRSQMYR